MFKLFVLGALCGLIQHYYGHANNFYEYRFLANRDGSNKEFAENLTDFYGNEDFMQIYCVWAQTTFRIRTFEHDFAHFSHFLNPKTTFLKIRFCRLWNKSWCAGLVLITRVSVIHGVCENQKSKKTKTKTTKSKKTKVVRKMFLVRNLCQVASKSYISHYFFSICSFFDSKNGFEKNRCSRKYGGPYGFRRGRRGRLPGRAAWRRTNPFFTPKSSKLIQILLPNVFFYPFLSFFNRWDFLTRENVSMTSYQRLLEISRYGIWT